jgi:Flp pilus assembly protein TadG
MSSERNSPFGNVLKNESGAAAILAAVAIPVLFGLAALSVDVGYVYHAQRVLQASTDAAALAGAQVIGTGGTPVTEATTYSANGSLNASTSFTNVTVAATLKCYTSVGLACSTNQTPSCASANANCSGTSGANGIEVVQTAAVPTFFARIFGIDTVNIAATASASMRGGVPTPLNVALIVDTTGSMGQAPTGPAATACSGYSTAIACAVDGAQTLLAELWPWQAGATSGTPVDEVALFVFPPVTNAGQATNDISCTSPQIPARWGSGGGGYSGVLNTTSAATTTSTLSLTTTMSNTDPLPTGDDPAFNTGSSWAVVTDVGTPTSAATPTTGSTSKTLTFPSGVVTTKITAGMTIQDTTNPSAIASGTTVSSVSTSANTVTMSASATGSGVASGDLITFGTSIPAGTGSWPWWGTGTSISSVTLPTTAVMSASPNSSPTGPGILKGDNIIVAGLYQIVGFGNDYRTSDTSSLNTSSNIVKITAQGCLKTPGGLNTYYADAISAAQSALVAEQAARVAAGGQGGTNVIVLLTDGDAPGSSTNPTSTQMGPLKSGSNECAAAVTAAQNAAAAGTKVYAVFYDDITSGSATCITDSGNYTGALPDGSCYTLQQTANSPGTTTGTYVNDSAKFYSTDGTSSPCPSVNNYSTMKTIFQNIATSLQTARLIPNNTT